MTEESEQPEQVEVKRLEQPPQRAPSFFRRLYNSLFPVMGGLILDFTDLATFGPIGLYFGFLLGSVIGWLVGTIYGFSTRKKVIWSILSGIYCMVPVTEFIPVATILSAVARFDKNT